MDRNDPRYDEWLRTRPGGGLHYYGDLVRMHLVAVGVFLVLLMPIDKELLPFYLVFGVILVPIAVILAGLTNPKSKLVIMADFVISLGIFCVFEYLSIARYIRVDTMADGIFVLRQIIAVIALSSLYLSTKTLRGMYYQRKHKITEL